MDELFHVDWGALFALSTPLAEIFLRGTLTYLMLFFLLRIVLKRQAGTVGITDLLVVVLIADAAQNAMAADYTSITDGFLLVATIIFWSYAIDWLGYHYRPIQRFVHPGPLELVRDGRIVYRNMRRELITKGELMTQIREQGIDNLESVKAAYMEGDGQISVITDGQETRGTSGRKLS